MSRTYDAAVGPRAGADSLSATQRSALRKTAWRFLPLLTVAYLFNYLDRTAIGVAGLTMNADLGIKNTQLGFAAGLFFLTYTLCEVPSNLALYRFGARRWIARIMITWGLISAAVAGPYMMGYLRDATGGFEQGVLAMAGVMAVTTILALSLKLTVKQE